MDIGLSLFLWIFLSAAAFLAVRSIRVRAAARSSLALSSERLRDHRALSRQSGDGAIQTDSFDGPFRLTSSTESGSTGKGGTFPWLQV